MYLILSHTKATTRNLKAGQDINVKGTSTKRWAIIKGDKQTALNVENCDGLTDDEKSQCVDSLPVDFVLNWN